MSSGYLFRFRKEFEVERVTFKHFILTRKKGAYDTKKIQYGGDQQRSRFYLWSFV